MESRQKSESVRILLVDDDASILRLYERFLSRAGFGVAADEDAESALERLRRESFDVLLTDILLPGADGLELTRLARRLQPGLVCLAMTASRSLHHASEARSLELAGYLLKPVGRAELVAAVRRAVDGAT